MSCHSTTITNFANNSTKINIPHDEVDHRTNPENASTSTQEQEPEATTIATSGSSALNVPEILRLMIKQVPPQDRTSIRRVSKAWQAAVEDQTAGHTLKPVGYDCWMYERVPSVPVYLVESQDCELRPNCYSGLIRVVLRKLSRSSTHPWRHDTTTRPNHNGQDVLRLRNKKTLICNQHESITHPPVTQVVACINPKGSTEIGDERAASLRVESARG